jgi:endonuclease/exonuclease/phosphatase family metal-dependent hydrolase
VTTRAKPLLAGLLVLALAGLTWDLSAREPAPAAFSAAAAGTIAGSVDRVVIGQFNIHRGTGVDDVFDLGRTAECLQGLDLISLNEVAGPGFWGGEDQATELGADLGLASTFAPAERRYWRPYFGNGLLSRRPPVSWLRLALPQVEGRAFRSLLIATVPGPGGPMTVLATHIDRADRDIQLAAVANVFDAMAPPAVLIGDLNANVSHPVLARLIDTPGVIATNGTLAPETHPEGVDWIIVKGLQAVEATSCDVGASDHPRVALTVASQS